MLGMQPPQHKGKIPPDNSVFAPVFFFFLGGGVRTTNMDALC